MSTFSNVEVRLAAGQRITAKYNAPSKLAQDNVKVFIAFRNDKRYMWTNWWLRELYHTYPVLAPAIKAIRLWFEARGLVGDRMFDGPTIQMMVIHILMMQGVIPPLEQGSAFALKSRCKNNKPLSLKRLAREVPPRTEREEALLLNKTIRRFFLEFAGFDWELNGVQVTRPLVLQDQDLSQYKGDGGKITVKDPWDTLNPNYTGTGRNFAAQIKSIQVRRYFSRCCDEARKDLHASGSDGNHFGDVSDEDIDQVQIGLSIHGLPLQPPPTPREIQEKGADALPRRFAMMTLSDGTDPRHCASCSSAQQ
jgi:hypothetical protein